MQTIESEREYILLPNPKIRQILFDRTLELVEESEDYDTLIFLDKSARPLAHLFRVLFIHVYPEGLKPDIKFLNIGKEKTYFLKGMGFLDQQGEYLDKKNRFDFLNETEDLIRVFGQENIEELFSVLNFIRLGRRMVVDDLSYLGDSRELVLKILRIVDQGSQHSFFAFLNTPQRRMQFMDINFVAHLPWMHFNTFVGDPADHRRFLAVPRIDRLESLKLKQELDRLAEEGFDQIVKKSVS